MSELATPGRARAGAAGVSVSCLLDGGHERVAASRSASRPTYDLRSLADPYVPGDSPREVAVTIAYTYGWRTQSEVLPLERRHVDLNAGTLRLDPGMTKNDDGRVIYLIANLKAMLAAQVKRVEALPARLRRIIPWLFRTAERGAGQGSRVEISARRRQMRARPRACWAGFGMTSAVVQRYGTGSTWACPSAWP